MLHGSAFLDIFARLYHIEMVEGLVTSLSETMLWSMNDKSIFSHQAEYLVRFSKLAVWTTNAANLMVRHLSSAVSILKVMAQAHRGASDLQKTADCLDSERKKKANTNHGQFRDVAIGYWGKRCVRSFILSEPLRHLSDNELSNYWVYDCNLQSLCFSMPEECLLDQLLSISSAFLLQALLVSISSHEIGDEYIEIETSFYFTLPVMPHQSEFIPSNGQVMGAFRLLLAPDKSSYAPILCSWTTLWR